MQQQGEPSGIFESHQSYEQAPIKFEPFSVEDPYQQLPPPTLLPSYPPRISNPTSDPSGKGKGRET